MTNLSLRTALGFSNIADVERSLENVVCIELLSRGYDVKIGRIKDKEIDFIAQKSNDIRYFQVSYMLHDEKQENVNLAYMT